MTVHVALDDELLAILDKKRGRIPRGLYIQMLIAGDADVVEVVTGSVKADDVSVPVVSRNRYQDAIDFFNRIKAITYDIDYERASAFEFEAKGIAKNLGIDVDVAKKGFYDGEGKFICGWWKK